MARWACVDGNEAAARIAYALSETIAIYPITPASPMGELADVWAAADRPNLWGDVPKIVEMQSEGGAAGALHGAATTGSLATTFTASQGLLLMLPNMFKLAGELTPAVIHVAARTIATHALSIFGDHSDVMAARTTGFALLASSSVQEAHDLAAVAHAATLESRVPVLHFFDGFRTSHEINRIALLDDDDLRALLEERWVDDQHERGLTPLRPVLRGTAQNPDVFFQAREAANPFYAALPAAVQAAMDRLAARTGRQYQLVEYEGAPDADRVIVLMGSGAGAVAETVATLTDRGEKVGVVTLRLYRPFPMDALVAAIPPTARRIAVLDRTKEPGSPGEPLYQDVVTAFAEAATTDALDGRAAPQIVSGRYGLSSKEFTPQMVKGVFDTLAAPRPRSHFTIGIVDDVTHTSLQADREFTVPRGPGDVTAVIHGLGSDGTVGSSKNTVRIVGEHTDLFAQGYFVYDSKKAGARTVSHLRFSPHPIRATYLVDGADLVACHQFGFLDRVDVLSPARPGATVLLNSPFGPDDMWDRLPRDVQEVIVDRDLCLFVVDAHAIARDVGLGGRINTVMQPCFFALANILPHDAAIQAIKESVEHSYAKAGPDVVARNLEAIDAALDGLHEMKVPDLVTATAGRRPPVPDDAPDFVRRVTARILAGEGDLLPVSALPVDGTFPTGTARFEKRAIAQEIPVWDPDLCIDCGKCAIVCPHAAIQIKVFEPAAASAAPDTFLSKGFRSRELDGHRLTVQVAPDDCTGCGVCVQACPAISKQDPQHRSLDLAPADDLRDRERANWDFFRTIPWVDRSVVRHDTTKGSQLLEPLFEFSGACAGCGETPYLKLLTQLFGDRIVVANATGCSSIFGGNLPTTPWATNADGHGPAWSNSLFEDNAEFGLGIQLAQEQQQDAARRLLADLGSEVGQDLARAILDADQSTEEGIAAQRERVAALKEHLAAAEQPQSPASRRLLGLADALVRSSIWIVGGDGWAYDIGFGGLDHVLASGRDVNILVLDSGVYSNTGGQTSKATPRGATAKFSAAGKQSPRKDLGLLAMQYGNVYVAQIALGGSDIQTVRALHEAEAWPGPSLILAYATCVEHGVDMSRSMIQMDLAVRSGFWPLYRYHPGTDGKPLRLDSRTPSIPLMDFVEHEGRFTQLLRNDRPRAERLLELAQSDVDQRWRYLEQLAAMEREAPRQ